MTHTPAWATTSGDVWATRWPELDRGLSGVAKQLDPAILAAASASGFRALDIGCGAGSTSLALVTARPDAIIIACDLSPSLIEIAEKRLAGTSAEPMLGDAEQVAAREGPFDLFYSRHGVMFFADPVRAFRTFRSAATSGASLIFSCFEDWTGNAWASELASAAAGHRVAPPDREPGGFAFADLQYVRSILDSAGWTDIRHRTIDFHYEAASGEGALSLLTAVGPASLLLRDLDEPARAEGIDRMRAVIERYIERDKVAFPAAASLWTARADA